MKASSNKGFTLIELLVVIAIIGLLSSVVLASMNSARKKSRDARRQQDLKSMQVALELFFDTAGGYPVQTTATDLVAAAQASTALVGTGVPPTSTAALVSAGSIGSIANDPTTGRYYYYVSSAAAPTFATSYCLGGFVEASTAAQSSCTGGEATAMGTILTTNPAGTTDTLVGP
jgi:prepilin-type N-terminal cleavage/methylation domain-containing protein